MEKADIGLIGLAVMGQNLVLNMEDHGYSVAVWNRTTSTMQEFIDESCDGKNIWMYDEDLEQVRRRPPEQHHQQDQDGDDHVDVTQDLDALVDAGAGHEVRIAKAHLASRGQPEELLGRVLHEVIPLNIQFTTKFYRTLSCIFIFRIIYGHHLFLLIFRVIR